MVKMTCRVGERQPLRPIVAMALVLLLAGLAARPLEVAAQPCPTSIRYVEAPADLDLDIGWTGLFHDQDFVNLVLTLDVSGCDNPTVPCGACTLSGPVPNVPLPPGPDNQRCVGNTSIRCTSDPICGANGPCHFFFDTPIPISKAGVAICLLNDITGAVTGTTNLDAGSVAVTVPLRSGVFVGTLIDVPCPLCSDTTLNDSVQGGMCNSGARAGLSCDSNGTTAFGNVSYDCPPSPANFVGYIRNADMDFTTGLVTRTTSAASPDCTDPAGASLKCLCDTCNNGNAEPCASNADCPDPPGPIAAICGGKRCLGGTNNGAPCAATTECPGGACGRPGAPTLPNACSDLVCTPNTPPDHDSINEGLCENGPVDSMCFPNETFRPCATDPDCTFPDTCVSMPRQCFTDVVTAVGMPNVPIADTAKLAWASLFCLAPTTSGAVNFTGGLPGLGRISTSGLTPAVPLDHFTCYKTHVVKGSVVFPGIANPPGVSLVDQFGTSTVGIKKPKLLCAPTNKNGEDPTAPSHPEHLRPYPVKIATKPVLPRNVVVTNQFGTLQIDVKRPLHLMVPTAKSLMPPSPTAPASPVTDHFECYTIAKSKGAAKFVPVTGVTLQDQFGPLTVTVKKPSALCAPVNKNNEEPGADTHTDHLMCYHIKVTGTKFITVPGALTNNQFAAETVDVRAPVQICVPSLKTVPDRFVDNGDGTVSDNWTGLMWEKKTTTPGSGINLADPHDVDNYYTWNNQTVPYSAPDGTAFTDFLVTLNTLPCFAGHCDWRLPTVDRNFDAPELDTILDLSACGPGVPCIDPIFGPTRARAHWSDTTYTASPFNAWYVYFGTDNANGYVNYANKTFNAYTRAVRTLP